MVERQSLRRSINSLGMRYGETHESKVWAQVGKGLCAWLLWKHADVIILHYEALLVLLVILVSPDVFKKLITMKYGGAIGQMTTTDTHEKTTKETVSKPAEKGKK